MLLTVKEMEILCIFYTGSLSTTLDLLRHIKTEGTAPPNRAAELISLVEKLSRMKTDDTICLAFEA